MLAQAYGQAGKPEEGIQTIEKALEAVAESGERTNEAELYRLKGELLLQSSKGPLLTCQADAPIETDEQNKCSLTHQHEAEICFEKALTVAKRQEAKSWELRTAVSLSKLMIHQNRHDAAYALLKPIYGWFTEGFETADLAEARELLKIISGDETL